MDNSPRVDGPVTQGVASVSQPVRCTPFGTCTVGNTLTDTNLELFLELDLQEAIACENAHHKVRPESHEGPAEWYVRVLHDCPGDSSVKGKIVAYCDRFVQEILSPSKVYVECATCRQTSLRSKFFQPIERIR